MSDHGLLDSEGEGSSASLPDESLLYEDPPSDAVEQSRRLETEGSGNSSSPPVVTEGPGATPLGSSSSSVVEVPVSRVESMEVDKSGSDVHMVTANPSIVSSDSSMSPPNVFKTNKLGPRTIEALGQFIKTLEAHSVHERMAFTKVWSRPLRAKKTEEMRTNLEKDISNIVDSLFLDRNIKFKDVESFSSEGSSTPSSAEQAVSGESASSEPVLCACADIHAMIVKCPSGKGHRALCEVRASKPFVIPKKKLTYTEAPKPQAKVEPVPTPSTSEAHQGRRGRGDRGRGHDNKRRHQSRSSNRSRSPPRKEAKGRGGKNHRYYQDRRPAPPPTTPAPSTSSSGGNTIPSTDQFKKLMSKAGTSTFGPSYDVRLKQPGHGLQEAVIPATRPKANPEPPKPVRPIEPAKPGQSCLDAQGEIEWHRMPRRPKGLPADINFRARPVNGVWVVECDQ